MTGKRVLQLAAIVLLAGSSEALASPTDSMQFDIVVHRQNPAEAITRKEASRIFLKKNAAWADGSEIVPVDQSPDAEIRAAFSSEVHGRPVSAILAYWRQKVFSGRSVPPQHESSDGAVLHLVETSPTAIGYVSRSALTDNVKVLRIIE